MNRKSDRRECVASCVHREMVHSRKLIIKDGLTSYALFTFRKSDLVMFRRWSPLYCSSYHQSGTASVSETRKCIQRESHLSNFFVLVACYICADVGKGSKATAGACMQCNKSGCKQQFHVTCAQQLGLLCEEAGNYLDNVKYCGYCQHHYSKLVCFRGVCFHELGL